MMVEWFRSFLYLHNTDLNDLQKRIYDDDDDDDGDDDSVVLLILKINIIYATNYHIYWKYSFITSVPLLEL
jgi:hypothetical protein